MRRFHRLSGRLAAMLTVGTASLSVPLLPAAASAASTGHATCSGGSVAAGTYQSLRVTGFCSADAGAITVTRNLKIAHGAALIAAFGGSDLNVHGNVVVGSGAILVLGCEPVEAPCFNDPNAATGGTMSTDHHIGGNLTAGAALMVIAHHNTISGNVTQSGGGGGVTCSIFPLGPNGPPAFSTYEDNAIGRNLLVSGLRTCWLGLIRNNVVRNVNFDNNVTADPDGNEVVTNSVGWNLNCHANSPAPQVGDSEGSPNTVGRKATGQCVKLT